MIFSIVQRKQQRDLWGVILMARKADGAEGSKVSKAHAYRDAAETLGMEATLEEVHNFIIEKYSIDMSKTQISQYRSNEKKRQGTAPGKRGRKPKHAAAATAHTASVNHAPKPAASRTDPLVEFVSTMRGWENKIGSDKICEMISALYSKK